MKPTLTDIIELARNAGSILYEGFGTDIEIRHKGRIDLVTEMDNRSEDYLLKEIHQRFPEHSILTEESGQVAGDADQNWIIDPLDGTLNYAHGMPIYAVSIAYAENQQVRLGVVMDPSRGECFSAERGKGAWLNGKPIQVSTISELVDSLLVTGFSYDTNKKENNLDNFERFFHEAQAVRRLGSATLDIAYVGAGRIDGYWNLESHPWDIAAAALIVEEAGGITTSLNGHHDYLKSPFSLVAANPHVHPKILKVLQEQSQLV
jgi:myo-inositol-1(or 4)-monophosphatase